VNPRLLLLLAPVIFAAHVLEEAPGLLSAGYVSWFNSIVPNGLGEPGFVRANIAPLLITAALAGLAAFVPRLWIMYILLIWLTHFMFANALFHLLATVVLHRYSPGVVTGAAFYLPFFAWFVRDLRKRFRASPEIILLIVILAGLPMFLQTYMVIFKHSRYF
jgi:Protein of unknown function with HXXEE motif